MQDAAVWLHTGAHGTLSIAEVGRLLRIDGRLDDPPKPELVTDQLPKEGWHGWRYISFGPDGWLYIPIGAPCNATRASATTRALRPSRA